MNPMKLRRRNIFMMIGLVVAEICIFFTSVILLFEEVVVVFIADSSVPASAVRDFVGHCSFLAHLEHVLPLRLDVAEHVIAVGGHRALMTALELIVVIVDLIV